MGVQIQGDTGNVIATKGTYSGNVTIGGTLTYEDVTNVDSIGIVTARNGIEVGARPGVAASISVDGNMIVSGVTTIGSNLKVGTGVTLSPDGDAFHTGVVTATSFSGDGSALTGVGGTDFIHAEQISVSGIVTAQAFVPTAQGRFPRNMIINGGALVAQRAKDATEVQSTGYGSVDRFRLEYSGTDEAPVQLQSTLSSSDSGDNPYKAGLTRAFHVRNGNQTSVGAADYLIVLYRIEAADLRNSGWDYTNPNSFVTLSYYIKVNTGQNFYVTLKTADGTPQKYAMETGTLSNQTWKRVTHTIPGNSNLQFDENTDEGLEIEWSLFRGTDYTGSMSLNAWAANNNSVRTPDQTNTWYDTNNANFELTGVQLELGPVATPFEIKTFADELRRCQRYFFKLGGYYPADSEVYTTLAFGIHANSTTAKTHIIHPVTMRSTDITYAASDITFDDDVASYSSGNFSSVGTSQSSGNMTTVNFTTANYGASAGRVTRCIVSSVGGFISADCEL